MRFFCLIGIVVLSGCAQFRDMRTELSAKPAETGSEEKVLRATLRDVYQDCPRIPEQAEPICGGFKAEVLPTTVSSKEQKIAPAQAVLVERFLYAGLTLSDFYCDRFFRATNQSARKRRFARSATNDAGGAVSAALGLAKVASGIVGGIGAGFSFVDSEFRNYDESFMVDADLAKMRRLVLSAQDKMRFDINAKVPSTVFGAETTILRYAGLCSFLGMQDLLNDSIAEKTSRIDQQLQNEKKGDPRGEQGASGKTARNDKGRSSTGGNQAKTQRGVTMVQGTGSAQLPESPAAQPLVSPPPPPVN